MIPASGAGGREFDSRITPCGVPPFFFLVGSACLPVHGGNGLGQKIDVTRQGHQLLTTAKKRQKKISPYWDSNPESPAP